MIKVIVKIHEPEKEIRLEMDEEARLKDVIKKIKVSSLDDYAILINGISVKDLNKKVKNNSKIVILPKIMGG